MNKVRRQKRVTAVLREARKVIGCYGMCPPGTSHEDGCIALLRTAIQRLDGKTGPTCRKRL